MSYIYMCKVPFIIIRILNVLDRCSKNIQIPNLLKSVLWEPSCSMRTDRQTDGQRVMTLSLFSEHALKSVPLFLIDLWGVQSGLDTRTLLAGWGCCPQCTRCQLKYVFLLSGSQACYPLSRMVCERSRIKTARTCRQSSAIRRGWRIKALLCCIHVRWWLRYITD